MKFLFFYSRLSLGGVETFIVRLSNWLIENGNQVCLVLIEASELDSQLHEDVQVFYFQTILRTFSPILHSSIRNALSPEIDAVCAFDPESFAMAAKTCHALSINKPYFYGVYHPRVLCPPWGGRWIGGVRRNLLRHYGSSSSLVFMNESCRRAQQACLGLSLAESKILPVAMPTTVPRLVRPVPRKIVSVGRLVPFKSYNLYMIDIVGQLVQKGVKNLTWHVYGDGMLRDEMQERINERGLQRNVFLHGSVPYSEFRTVVEDASVFVGMGTSLIEAGMIGVPGIPAIDSAGPMTYGYTHHLETYDVGEHLGRPPDRSVADLIEDLFQMPEEEYK
ncbi:MAG: glycosyltransferase, partial [Caldilineaceae bacterium]|nr:glycosyltransferase [Caldilineaceae bacterium]